jgi:hypothetical protein
MEEGQRHIPETRHVRLAIALRQIARWAAISCAIGFGCLVAFGRTDRPNLAVVALIVAVITAALVCLSAFVLRSAIEGQWRFGIRSLLIVTTLIAVVLGLIIWVVR